MTQLLTIWYITDNKQGHLNQLKGLSWQLKECASQFGFQLKEHWYHHQDPDLNWTSLVRNKPKDPDVAKPSMIVGAGHKTHLKLIALARKFRAFSIVLMRPSLPLKLFDAAIVPLHDRPPIKPHILSTRGVLNKVKPKSSNGAQSVDKNPEERGLILVGGQSKHYLWNTESIVAQIIEIADRDSAFQWTISNSRRTPNEFINQLEAADRTNIFFVDCQHTDGSWLPSQLQQASFIWVTPDSVSMVYEAITSGAPTALLDLIPSKQNRIVKGISELVTTNMATTYKQWQETSTITPPSVALKESERAAQWVLNLYKQRLEP